MSQTTDRNQQHARSESAELNTAIADAAFLTVFLSLQGEERAARWRMLDHGSKFRLVARQIERLGSDWLPSDVEAQIVKCDARYALGPVEAAVEGALERLALEHAAAGRLATEAGDKAHATAERRQTTAFTNALIEYRRGVRPQLLESGAWLLPSRRAGEAPHIVTMDGDWICSCPASSNAHWPLAMIIGIEVAYDMMSEHDDGAPESELDAALTRTRQTLEAMRAQQAHGRRLAQARGGSQWAA